jgi:Branched-chain amino acid aminotransferase/4-amino-4-deoxychorismate lyase
LSFRERVEKVIAENTAYEAILVNNEGYITEGSKSNIFMVQGDTVITAPVELVLPGVTRKVIIDVLKCNGIPFEERKVHFSEIDKIDGLFISGTSPKVLPVRRIGNTEFKSSSNEVIQRIMKAYDDNIRDYIGGF